MAEIVNMDTDGVKRVYNHDFKCISGEKGDGSEGRYYHVYKCSRCNVTTAVRVELDSSERNENEIFKYHPCVADD